jgi:hypothetical protein
MAAHSTLLTLETSLPPRKELRFAISIALLPMASGENQRFYVKDDVRNEVSEQGEGLYFSGLARPC